MKGFSLSIGLLFFFTITLPLHAASGNAPVSCIVKGNLDVSLFLKATIFAEGFVEGYSQPFQDVLMRNQCQTNDILSLIQQRNKIEAAIVDSFLTCNTEKLPQMKKALNKVNAELFYARNVVKGALVVSLPYDLLTTRMLEDPESLFTPEEKLRAEMYRRYVDKGAFTPQEFSLFFDKMVLKYKTRKEQYVLCAHSSWATVEEKWREFLDTSGGITPAWKDLKKGVKRRAELIEAAAPSSFSDFLLGILAVHTGEVDAPMGVEELISRFYGDYLGGPTQRDIVSGLYNETFRYDLDLLRAEMSAYYEGVYKTGVDASVSLFMQELEMLNTLLRESIPLIDKVESCSASMNARQCPGT